MILWWTTLSSHMLTNCKVRRNHVDHNHFKSKSNWISKYIELTWRLNLLMKLIIWRQSWWREIWLQVSLWDECERLSRGGLFMVNVEKSQFFLSFLNFQRMFVQQSSFWSKVHGLERDNYNLFGKLIFKIFKGWK